MSLKQVLCTAGATSGLIYANGDVYRCMRDYNTRRSPMGNILDPDFDWFKGVRSCDQRLCNTNCDSDWTSKWLLTDGHVDRHVPAWEWDQTLEIRRPSWKDQTLDTPCDGLFISWFPTMVCNFTCPYCGCAVGSRAVWETFPSSSPELGTEQWLAFFGRIMDNSPWGGLQLSGGEPLLSPAVIPAFQLMAGAWVINLISNLSRNVDRLLAADIPPYDPRTSSGLAVTASLHPSTPGFRWDLFLDNVLALDARGYMRVVNYVAWPGHIFDFERYRDILAEHGVRAILQRWVGPDNKGLSTYTEEEKAYLNLHAMDHRNMGTILDLSGYVEHPAWQARLAFRDIPPGAGLPVETTGLHVRVGNEGGRTWDPAGDKPVLLGARLFPKDTPYGHALREYRCPLGSCLEPEDSRDLYLELDLSGLDVGSYILKVDMVRENAFWFSDLGTEAVVLDISI